MSAEIYEGNVIVLVKVVDVSTDVRGNLEFHGLQIWVPKSIQHGPQMGRVRLVLDVSKNALAPLAPGPHIGSPGPWALGPWPLAPLGPSGPWAPLAPGPHMDPLAPLGPVPHMGSIAHMGFCHAWPSGTPPHPPSSLQPSSPWNFMLP